MYNVTGIENSNNFIDLYIAINNLSNMVLTGVLMLVIFFLILIIFSNYDKKVVLIADSFLLIVLGMLFLTLGLIGWAFLLPPILIFFASLIYMYLYS